MNHLTQKNQLRIAIGVTGASGSIYAEELIKFLMTQVKRVYIVATPSGKSVINHELSLKSSADDFCLRRVLSGSLTEAEKECLRVFQSDDLFAPIASGSSSPDALVIVPCSMGSMARIAQGISSNLLERAADVMLKERRQITICPRETPLSSIHLENMLKLSQMGAHIVPAMPAFYQQPKTLNDMVHFVVGRLVESLGMKHDLYRQWNRRML